MLKRKNDKVSHTFPEDDSCVCVYDCYYNKAVKETYLSLPYQRLFSVKLDPIILFPFKAFWPQSTV